MGCFLSCRYSRRICWSEAVIRKAALSRVSHSSHFHTFTGQGPGITGIGVAPKHRLCLCVGFLPQKPGLTPRSVNMCLVWWTKWHWVRFFPQILMFCPVRIIPPMLHFHSCIM
jgi:hypothetical protein